MVDSCISVLYMCKYRICVLNLCISVLYICEYLICVIYLCHLLWHKLMFVYSKCIWKWFVWWTCDDSVKWYWPTLSWSALQCVVCRQMFCFSGQENHWRILHYSHMFGWKLSGITFDWLVYCSGLNFSKWSRQLCTCKYLICVMYLCHILCKPVHLSSVYMWISHLCYIPVPTFVTQTNVCL